MTAAPDSLARLDAGWTLCATPAGAIDRPEHLPDAGWCEARVPGTVAQALAAAGRFDPAAPYPLGESDYWYRLALPGRGARRLRLNGLATLAEVWLDGERLLCSTSMFIAHDLDLMLNDTSVLHLCFRSLKRHLDTEPSPGRARWRTRLAEPAGLRAVRTTLLGHMPGWFPAIEPIGPWRAIELLDPAAGLTVLRHTLHARVDGRDGRLDATLEFSAPLAPGDDARLVCGTHAVPLERTGPRTARAGLTLPEVALWWPHTHGEPTLHTVELELNGARRPLGRTGFRTIALSRGDDGRGFALSVNGVPLFARGACWSSADPLALHATPHAYRHALGLAREAGCNLLRIGGTMTYEAEAFYAACDELGLLVWQDFMLANFDYPAANPRFVDALGEEARQFLARHAANPCLAVLCGGSEIAQQAAMVGLASAQRVTPLTSGLLAELAAAGRPDAAYIDDSPHGGVLPFLPREGVSHYYGVGAYLRPPEDARRADVRFASECLAFANVPGDATLAALGNPIPHGPEWKRAVPRDRGASWDFDDVRDHYLHTLYGVAPALLRARDPDRYLALSRAVVADLMVATLSEWRRVGSRCAGALVWQYQDVTPGAGWGLVDAFGRPKSAFHALRQVSQPRQVLLTDEGLNGLDAHLLNDTPEPLDARLELVALRDGRTPVARAERIVRIAPHGGICLSSADLLGRFFDFTYAYRFGPREHDCVVASLHHADGALLSRAFHFPEPAAASVLEPRDLGLEATLLREDERWWVELQTRQLARHVRISAPGWRARDDSFHLAPGAAQRVELVAEPVAEPVDRSPYAHQAAPTADRWPPDPPVVDVRALNSNKTIRPRTQP